MSDEALAKTILKALVDDLGLTRVVALARDVAGVEGEDKRRRGRTVSLRRAADWAANRVPPDELAAARAKRARER